MANASWQALDAAIHPPYTGYGQNWHLRIDLPEGPELGDDPRAGLFAAWEANLPDLLERAMLLVSLIGYEGSLALVHGAHPPADGPLLGFMDFDRAEPRAYLTCEVLEENFNTAAEAFANVHDIDIVPRAVDAYRRNHPYQYQDDTKDTKEKEALEELRREGAPGFGAGAIKPDLDDEGNCVCCGESEAKPEPTEAPRIMQGGRNPHYYEDDGFTPKRKKVLEESVHGGVKSLTFDQRHEVINQMADWIEENVDIGGHLAANLVYPIHDLCMDPGTTYRQISEIRVSENGDTVDIVIDDHEHTAMVVTVREFNRYLGDDRKLRDL